MSRIQNISDLNRVAYAALGFEESPSSSLYGTDLSVSRALRIIDKEVRHNYEAMYKWFITNLENGREYGSREYGRGQRLPGVDSSFAHAAQRGIHVPSRQKYAATITIRQESLYGKNSLDGYRIALPDGTWLLSYAAHRNNTDGETAATWNRGLLNCCLDGIPVGVFIEEGGSYYRALAFVEDYDALTDTFLLHGPITSANSDAFFAPAKADAELAGLSIDIAALETDLRTKEIQETCKREGQREFKRQLLSAYSGKCAVCGGSVERTLQAAHILKYRGRQSNVVPNGLLLRADIHILYDNLLLSIAPDTLKVDLNPCLEGTEYEPLYGKAVEIPRESALRPDERLLAINYSRFKDAIAS